jgi:hypothetical protein
VGLAHPMRTIVDLSILSSLSLLPSSKSSSSFPSSLPPSPSLSTLSQEEMFIYGGGGNANLQLFISVAEFLRLSSAEVADISSFNSHMDLENNSNDSILEEYGEKGKKGETGERVEKVLSSFELEGGVSSKEEIADRINFKNKKEKLGMELKRLELESELRLGSGSGFGLDEQLRNRPVRERKEAKNPAINSSKAARKVRNNPNSNSNPNINPNSNGNTDTNANQ